MNDINKRIDFFINKTIVNLENMIDFEHPMSEKVKEDLEILLYLQSIISQKHITEVSKDDLYELLSFINNAINVSRDTEEVENLSTLYNELTEIIY